MLLIECPYCGKRPELEFSHAGQAHIARAQNPAEVSVQEWTDFLYMRDNTKGVHAERWRHTHGCARYFNALRDTTTDHFLATYKAGEQRPEGVGAGAGVGTGTGASSGASAGRGASGTTGSPLGAGAGTDPGAGSNPGAPKVGL
jgi:sarcosine oxidase, subunit delta